MSTAAPITPARRAQIDAYQNKLYRSTYAIRKELQEGLTKAVEASGAASVSDLLAMLAHEPERTGAALKPVFEEIAQRKGSKTTMKAALQEIKDADLTPEEILAAIQAARAAKGNPSGDQV